MNIQSIYYDIASNLKYKIDLDTASENMLTAIHHNAILQANQVVTKIEHLDDVRDKQHNDGLARDPLWINGVHCHASLSRHNYIYLT